MKATPRKLPEMGKAEQGTQNAAKAILGKLKGAKLGNLSAITIGLHLRDQEAEEPEADAEDKADAKKDAKAK